MELLHTEEVFRFCAIPQVMAIATLSELYNNPKVFTGVVKIRKGMSAKLILDTKTRGGNYRRYQTLPLLPPLLLLPTVTIAVTTTTTTTTTPTTTTIAILLLLV